MESDDLDSLGRRTVDRPTEQSERDHERRDTFRLRGDNDDRRPSGASDGEGGVYGRHERVWSQDSSKDGDGGDLYGDSRPAYTEQTPSVLKGVLVMKEDEGMLGYQQDLVE